MTFLTVLLITSLLCLGTYEFIHEMYYTFKGKKIDSVKIKVKHPHLFKVLKPLALCAKCFASFWGASYFLLVCTMFGYEIDLLWLCLNSIALIFVNGLLHDIYQRI